MSKDDFTVVLDNNPTGAYRLAKAERTRFGETRRAMLSHCNWSAPTRSAALSH